MDKLHTEPELKIVIERLLKKGRTVELYAKSDGTVHARIVRRKEIKTE